MTTLTHTVIYHVLYTTTKYPTQNANLILMHASHNAKKSFLLKHIFQNLHDDSEDSGDVDAFSFHFAASIVVEQNVMF